MKVLQLQRVPRYWAGASLRRMLPPHPRRRMNVQKSAGEPDPVAPGTTEGPIEQGLYCLQVDSPKEDEEMKGGYSLPSTPS